MSEHNESDTPATPQEPPEVTVTTLPFALTPDAYAGMIFRLTYWKIWWQMVLAVFAAVLSLFVMVYFEDESSRGICFMGFAISCSLLLLWTLYPYFMSRSLARHSANKPIMRTRTMILSKDRITINEAESESRGNYTKEDIFAIEKCKDYYIIWITQLLMLYLPRNAFASPEDLETFESTILPAYTELKRSIKRGLIYLLTFWVSCIVIGCIIAFARSNHPLP